MNLVASCAADSNRCSVLARLVLARILTEEVPDYARALPYVQEALSRYPQNWAFENLALEEAKGLGLDRSESQNLVENVSAMWDNGWRPPSYAKVDPTPLRQQLVQAYLRQGRQDAARRMWAALVKDSNPSVALSDHLAAE
jgi:hypothetical protein